MLILHRASSNFPRHCCSHIDAQLFLHDEFSLYYQVAQGLSAPLSPPHVGSHRWESGVTSLSVRKYRNEVLHVRTGTANLPFCPCSFHLLPTKMPIDPKHTSCYGHTQLVFCMLFYIVQDCLAPGPISASIAEDTLHLLHKTTTLHAPSTSLPQNWSCLSTIRHALFALCSREFLSKDVYAPEFQISFSRGSSGLSALIRTQLH